MEIVICLLFFSLLLLYISFFKSDYTLLLFSFLVMFFCGLYIVTEGIVPVPGYNFAFGAIIIFLSIYIGIRTALSMLRSNLNSKREYEELE